MANLKQLPKPNSDISDYEWEITPNTVKIIIDRLQQLLQQKQQKLDTLERENRWLREQLDLRLDKPNRAYTPPVPEVLLWAVMGLVFTIAGTFIPASSFLAPWSWFSDGFEVQTLGVSYQVGAVLLTACLGGKNAGLFSQVAYVLLGMTGLSIFDRGGGLEYLQQPNFGYLLGFIIGAWLCGWLAFQTLVRFSVLIASCLVGLLAIHLVGLVYLTAMYFGGWETNLDSLWQGIIIYSLQPLPGQLAVVCAVSLVAFVVRKLMFS